MIAAATRLASLCSPLLAVLLCVGCSDDETRPDDRLRAWVGAIDAAAEAKDRRAIVDRISPAYGDARGNNRDDISNMLRVYFLRSNRVEFIPDIEQIDIIGGTAAKVALRVAMAGTTQGMFGIRADAYRFELELEERDGEWLLISARWAELGRSPH